MPQLTLIYYFVSKDYVKKNKQQKNQTVLTFVQICIKI